MAEAGLEADFVNTFEGNGLGKTDAPSAAESGAVDAQKAKFEPDLQKLIESWPELSDGVRNAILSLAEGPIPQFTMQTIQHLLDSAS